MSYLALTETDRRLMMESIGVSSIEELFEPIPAPLRLNALALPPGLTESETRAKLRRLASRNRVSGSTSFLGAGCYQHSVPAAVSALVARSEFATAYTPYQAEVSQGTLQAIFEFQSVICELTGLDVANASTYDGSSAAAEAALMALRATKRRRIVCSGGLHPETLKVIETYASGPGISVDTMGLEIGTGRTPIPSPGNIDDCAAVLVQQPNFFGVIEDVAALVQAAHSADALLVVIQHPLTLALLEAPGKLGADIAAGELQAFGNPMSFGGATAGYLACREQHVRQLPGRIVGQTVDAGGRTCYALTLQAREQHIRRAKATSNICSNQALNALAATIYVALLGPQGLAELAQICLERAHSLQARLCELPGISPFFEGPFFNEFALRLPGDAGDFATAMRKLGIDPGVPLGRFSPDLANILLVAVTEENSPADLDSFVAGAETALRQRGAAER
ncbi:MAG: aminomethyl-transferring glycine dehydrogenase subunit GcvPA [Actinobacteria bacterium]|nr:aminomethyl-transferring glycine dehydrogenase subunit GcvPA [Actinomycetota bacterium]